MTCLFLKVILPNKPDYGFFRRYYGPELISQRLFKGDNDLEFFTKLIYKTGKPAQNGYIERFNRTDCEDVLGQSWFHDLDEVRNLTEE